nr:MAG TPA: hypothetical protein [Caudoviricetes sp.]
MDAFLHNNIQNQIFAAQCEEANRIFTDFNNQLALNTQAGVGSCSQEADNSAFDAKYSAAKAEIARIRAEMEAGF